MRSIGGLLRRGRPGEQAEFSAAFIVGAVNAALAQDLKVSPADAKATSFRSGAITIGVSHGAIAGLIQQSADQLLAQANAKLQESGGQAGTIKKILTRPMTM